MRVTKLLSKRVPTLNFAYFLMRTFPSVEPACGLLTRRFSLCFKSSVLQIHQQDISQSPSVPFQPSPMPLFTHLSLLLLCVFLFLASASLSRPTFNTLQPTQVLSFRPYAYYASAGYCKPNTILSWTCGLNCDSNPSFRPIASGGDGGFVQYWFVGYDPVLQSVIVVHQGTNPFVV
jgi:hypothetical protein